MLSVEKDRTMIFVAGAFLAALLSIAVFVGGLWPARPDAGESDGVIFRVVEGEGFRAIADRLEEEGLIRSTSAFKLYSLLTGSASHLKPGTYKLSAAMSAPDILSEIVAGEDKEVAVTVQEGASAYEIDLLLSKEGIVKQGEFLNFVTSEDLEGKLFPDTYRFFRDSSVVEIAGKFLENFRSKIGSKLDGLKEREVKEVLTLASLVEKEVPDLEDRKIVAGILKKRLARGMPLQVDATICYIKKVRSYPDIKACYPFNPLDFKIDLPYNTYLYKGLPPGPIGNPGLSAISAVLAPTKSPYWYYLSDPKTKKTIFAATLDEHNENRVKYLGL